MDAVYCPRSGKQCFDNRHEAQKALRNMKVRTASEGSVYQCPDCHKWHISHYSYRKGKAIRTFLKKNN